MIINSNRKGDLNIMKKIIALFCACFLLITTVDIVVPRSETKVFDSVIRLHILADDNGEEAQGIKLLVRDAILEECGDIFSQDGNIVAATETVEVNLSRIENIANRVLSEQGVDYEAEVKWGFEEYPTRVYENLTLPSGTYRSLRVSLGSGKGNNWWCVLFPPLCTKVSTADNLSSNSEITERDSQVFTKKKYIFRFKLLEIFW